MSSQNPSPQVSATKDAEGGPLPRQRFLIGITGNIACGKSTVMRELSRLGAHTIDADMRVHDILLRSGDAYRPVLDEFGDHVLGEDGEIDRRALGRIVFTDSDKLRRLEEITHPIVRRVIEREIASSPSPVVALDAIKLFESGWAKKCYAVWVVSCDPEQQLERIVRTRGYSKQEAQERILAQSPQEEKIARADLVIDNTGTLEQTRQQVQRAWDNLFAEGRTTTLK